jgi:predicted alpha/beta hydrolase family esterase
MVLVHEGAEGIILAVKKHVKRTVNTDAEDGEYDGMKVEMLFMYSIHFLFINVKKSQLKQLIKEIVVEVLSNGHKNDKTIVIVHGWSGSPKDNWIPYAKSSFKKLGYGVICPTMPHSDNPTIKDWVSFLSKVVDKPNKNTYFIGHSIGCQTIMRYLETIDTKVGGVVFVAGFFDLKGLGDDEKTIAKPWLETPINTKKVKNNMGFSIVFLSNDDPDVPYQKNKEKFEEYFGSKIITVDDAGHFTSDDGYDSFPKLVSVVDTKISK